MIKMVRFLEEAYLFDSVRNRRGNNKHTHYYVVQSAGLKYEGGLTERVGRFGFYFMFMTAIIKKEKRERKGKRKEMKEKKGKKKRKKKRGRGKKERKGKEKEKEKEGKGNKKYVKAV
jgi:hypothetical protein